MNVILTTPRLLLREPEADDLEPLFKILSDEDVMYAYHRTFSRDETRQWIARQRARYSQAGIGLFSVVLRQTNQLIGQCGITEQVSQLYRVPEIGFLLSKDHWHNGYAAEAAAACRDYAFDTLGLECVYSIISSDNTPSRAVARRIGMSISGSIVHFWHGHELLHLVYEASRT